MIEAERDGIVVLRSELLDRFPELGHAFSTRGGGVSGPPYASLNLASASGDDRERVIENRRRLCASVGAPFPPAIPKQVLGSEVVPIEDLARDADGVATDEAGRTLLTLSADCVLVLLYDPVRRAIANVHSSRHGARGEITKRMVSLLRRRYGSRPRDLVAAIGPSIGPCCYEIRADVEREWKGSPFLARQDGRTILDLWAVTRAHLEEAGVTAIDEARLCTKCHPGKFFSYRREGEKSGRFGAVIWRRT